VRVDVAVSHSCPSPLLPRGNRTVVRAREDPGITAAVASQHAATGHHRAADGHDPAAGLGLGSPVTSTRPLPILPTPPLARTTDRGNRTRVLPRLWPGAYNVDPAGDS